MPELGLRRALHALGLRYRVDYAPLTTHKRRRADIVFTKAKVAVFIDGCFWHGCPDHHTIAKTNADYWANKVAQNRARDRETDELLKNAGWQAIRIWEHESIEHATQKILEIVHPTGGRAVDP